METTPFSAMGAQATKQISTESKAGATVLKPDDLGVITSGSLSDNDISFKIVKNNPALMSLETGYPLADFVSSVKSKDIRKEYHEDLKKATFTETHSKNLYDDVKVSSLNRYSDILPFRSNKIDLPPNSLGSTYINASYISSTIPGDSKAYIASQGPLKHTVDDFWSMIIQEKINFVIMLCKFAAGDRPQCFQYFPQKGKSASSALYKVTCTAEEEEAANLVHKTFELVSKSGTVTFVHHYQWLGWPDHGVPDVKDYGILVNFVKRIILYKSTNKEPILIHCSAGVGRTGTLISLTNLALIIKRAKELSKSKPEIMKETNLSVFSVVRRMREERLSMVQTVEQYELVYKITQLMLTTDLLSDI
jgi:receptor-type tyrosine-protein phosphatase gamma